MARYNSKSWRAYKLGDSKVVSVAASPPLALSPNCRILGIDPGSRLTGFGIVDVRGVEAYCVVQGRIDVTGLSVVKRMAGIYQGIQSLIATHAPSEVAIERVFVNKNIDSALKLGQARGAALAALGSALEVSEYAPRAVKLATVGFGGADKTQVIHMMRQMLAIEDGLTSDAADALAVALCHAQHRRMAYLLATRSDG